MLMSFEHDSLVLKRMPYDTQFYEYNKTLIRPHPQYCVQLRNPAPEYGNWSHLLKIDSNIRMIVRLAFFLILRG